MIRPEEWEPIRASRVAAAAERLRALPQPYQEWVTRNAQSRGCPTLRRDTLLGPGQVTTYDALIAVCERELTRRAANPGGNP